MTKNNLVPSVPILKEIALSLHICIFAISGPSSEAITEQHTRCYPIIPPILWLCTAQH
jgi:hypothetical protein